LVYFSLYPPSGIIFNNIHNYLEIMFPIDVLRFSEFRTMRNHLSETLILNDIQITSDYMSRWVVLKRRVGAAMIFSAGWKHVKWSLCSRAAMPFLAGHYGQEQPCYL
jgi:hypothetical protein